MYYLLSVVLCILTCSAYHPQLSPEFQSTLQQWQNQLLQQLENSLPRSADEGDHSVYTGTAGIALMYLHLHSVSGDQSLIQVCASCAHC